MLLFRDAFMEALHGNQLTCVVHAAHAAEILLKARIAQEDLRLIFYKLPKSSSSKDTFTLIELLEEGRTLSYQQLPDKLEDTTGIKIPQRQQYSEFGRLRDQIMHFGIAKDEALDKLTLSYSLEVLDPLVESFWGRSVIDFIKNDPSPGYTDILYSGMLEDSIIKQGFFIDQRLRRLLGEISREAWEYIQAYCTAADELYESKTDEDWKAEAEAWENSPAAYTDEDTYEQMIKDQANWTAFLDSF